MEELDEKPDPLPELKVGIVYNLKKGIKHEAADFEAEYDNIETVAAIKKALECKGVKVQQIEADMNLSEKLKEAKVNIVFNIAEGRSGRGREAQIPALLNLLGIPFTGSDETTLCLALDKALTKRLLTSYHIKTPGYYVVNKNGKLKSHDIEFPVIVKPNAEGSSKGISDVSIVETRDELKKLLKDNIKLYGQDMLVEEYIDGREFTVGVLGNGEDIKVFRPMEIVYLRNTQDNYKVYSYNVKQNFKKFVKYECPAKLSKETEQEMMDIAHKVYEILGCKDFSRIDFRVSNDNKIYFIEINPLPGLAPEYSDYIILAELNGVDYDAIVRAVFIAALKRQGIDIPEGLVK